MPVPLRYAVLHHTGVAGPHFDLLFETAPGSPLAAWRSPAWPLVEPARLTRIPDHRPLYLTFEGEVGGGRGHVARVAGGTCAITGNAAGGFVMHLDPVVDPPGDSAGGDPPRGTDLHLIPADGDAWVGETRHRTCA